MKFEVCFCVDIIFHHSRIVMGNETPFTKRSGFVEYPLFVFNEDFLRSIDKNGCYDEYLKNFKEYLGTEE